MLVEEVLSLVLDVGLLLALLLLEVVDDVELESGSRRRGSRTGAGRRSVAVHAGC